MKNHCKILGVDPAPEMEKFAKAKGVPTMTAFFDAEAAEKIIARYGNAKVIIANNVLAHIDDIQSVFKGIGKLLKQNGVCVFEAHFVGNLIGKGGFDQIYHEHLCYFSLHALSHLMKRFGLKILDVTTVPIHGESLRVTVGKTDSPKRSVELFLRKEKKIGLHKIETFRQFANKVENNKRALISLIERLKAQNKKITGYGAPAKGNTLLNFYGIGPDMLDHITDTTPLKQGLFAPGSKIPVVPPEENAKNPPDYILLLSWNYTDAILKKEAALRKKGVKFIIPVPEVKIV